ncbi:MAG: beta-galactosidase, partial [Microbacterium sp.]
PLEPALGLRVEEHLPLRHGHVAGVSFDGRAYPAETWQEDLTLSTAEIRATYTGGPAAGRAAITRNAHGAGAGWYVSTRPDAAGLAAVLDAVYLDAGIAPAGLPAGVEAIRRVGDEAEYLVAINHGTDAVSLQTSGFDLLTQEQARGMLVLNAGDVAVIRTQRTAEGGGR